ncbi:Mitochondrial import inner membrane translocase subunit TIM14-3 [Platanthera guangdongensis]|uniref:Mitochondrial import inner membrane translocase subunit TIM14-3 n=1 Tax=Platanthera guangdongensis TaxID=2320717 RepID=A0ABR2ME19_9ASPA
MATGHQGLPGIYTSGPTRGERFTNTPLAQDRRRINEVFSVFLFLAYNRSNCRSRENTPPDKIREAHRKVLVANHPDAGGSHYLPSKINEAKDMMIGKSKGSGSAF